jgi:hypothetical protein
MAYRHQYQGKAQDGLSQPVIDSHAIAERFTGTE